MLESCLEHVFRQRVRAAGGLVLQLAPTTAGAPDRLVLFEGNMYLVELKSETGSLSAIQLAWHRKAAHHGIEVVVLQGRDEILRWTAAIK